MPTTVLSTKGQLIIPSEIRARHGWIPGTELELEDRGDSLVIRARVDVPRTSIEDVLGCLRYDGPAKSIEEMNQAVARAARASR